jgi:hypothetical protein
VGVTVDVAVTDAVFVAVGGVPVTVGVVVGVSVGVGVDVSVGAIARTADGAPAMHAASTTHRATAVVPPAPLRADSQPRPMAGSPF